ncbi:MAG: chloride channel protein, partial [Gammaproteobacteria bacterium]|nr:chloride channel protein [Gammaproteobacteria bacterium]
MTVAMEFLRRQLSESAALPELSVLAVAVGLVTGVVVLLFRGAIDGVSWLLHGQTTDGHASLGLEWRVALPV